MPRPYLSWSTEQLTALVDGDPTNRKALEDVLDELAQRRTQGAAVLRRLVEALLAAGAMATSAETARRTAKQAVAVRGSEAQGDTGQVARGRRRSSPPVLADPGRPQATAAVPAVKTSDDPGRDHVDVVGLAERHALLRSTFTLEAEVLARWGLTPLMPVPLRQDVRGLWERRLRQNGPAGHPYRLSLDDLHRDLGPVEAAAPEDEESS